MLFTQKFLFQEGAGWGEKRRKDRKKERKKEREKTARGSNNIVN